MKKSEHYGELQDLIDELFESRNTLTSMELLVNAEIRDLHPDLIEICQIVPPGTYSRQALCDQLNSAIAGHGWGSVYGTVD